MGKEPSLKHLGLCCLFFWMWYMPCFISALHLLTCGKVLEKSLSNIHTVRGTYEGLSSWKSLQLLWSRHIRGNPLKQGPRKEAGAYEWVSLFHCTRVGVERGGTIPICTFLVQLLLSHYKHYPHSLFLFPNIKADNCESGERGTKGERL